MDRCRCQGVRDAKESVSCEVSVWEEMVSRRSGRSGRFVCRRCSLNGGVSYKACHRRRAMSPCPVVGEIPVEAVVSPVVPVD